MGPSFGKKESFKFDESLFSHLIQAPFQESSQTIFKENYCVFQSHDKNSIDIICINMDCKAQNRKLCVLCIRDEIHIRDKNYNMSKLKSIKEISQIISSFKDLIQTEIQSFEFDLLIVKLQLFYEQNNQQQLHSFEQLFENLQDFNQNVSSINIQTYLDCLSDANTSLFEYFIQISSQLIELQNQYYNNNLFQNERRINQQNEQSESEEFAKKKHQILLYLNQNSNYSNKIKNIEVQNVVEREIENIFKYVYQLYKSKNYDGVIEICQEILMQIKLSENQEQNLLKIRAKTYYKLGKIDEAIYLSCQLDSSYPKIPYFFKLKAEQLLKENKFHEAITSYDQLMHHYPQYPFSYFKKAKLLEFCHNYEEAISLYDEIMKLKLNEKLELHIYKIKAKLLEKCNRLDEVIGIYKIMIQLRPKDLQLQQELNELHEKQLLFTQVIEFLIVELELMMFAIRMILAVILQLLIYKDLYLSIHLIKSTFLSSYIGNYIFHKIQSFKKIIFNFNQRFLIKIFESLKSLFIIINNIKILQII